MIDRSDIYSLLNRRIQKLTASGGSMEEAVKCMQEFLAQERETKASPLPGNVVPIGRPRLLAK